MKFQKSQQMTFLKNKENAPITFKDLQFQLSNMNEPSISSILSSIPDAQDEKF
jgi:hypothetical protein